MYGYMGDASTIRQEYVEWLCRRVRADGCSMLMKELFRIPFRSFVNHDENRAADGLVLRERYLEETDRANGEDALSGECSMLEMLIGLSERMAFEMASPEVDDPFAYIGYFWELIGNMSMTCYTDERFVELDAAFNVPEIANYIIERRYAVNGVGGLFPLRAPNEDQRSVELWYQMQAYLRERYDENDYWHSGE